MRIFVTGGAGYLGRRVVERLLRDGHNVRCLLRSRAAALELQQGLNQGNRLEVVFGSLQDHRNLKELVAPCDQIFHLAAAVKGSPSTLFMDTVVGTRALLDVVDSVDIERFVLVSSIAVYGTHGLRVGSRVTEDCALDPNPHLRDPYTYSKTVQEQLCWEAFHSRKLPLVVIRPGVIYGPGRPALLNRLGPAKGNFVIRVGSGDRVPCTYVDNCADAICLAGRVSGVDGRAYNIIDDDTPTRSEVVRAYRRRGDAIRVLPIPTRLVKPVSAAYEWYWRRSQRLVPPVLTRYRITMWKPLKYDNRRAKAELGWRAAVTTKAALESTFGPAVETT